MGMTTPKNQNKQVRLTEALRQRLEALSRRTEYSESDILRSAIEAGLDRLESGEYNPFVTRTAAEKLSAQNKKKNA